MNIGKTCRVLTSESVSEGHPDKVCDQISDAILDECLKQDEKSRVACETLATNNLIVLSGEISTKANVNWERLAREVVRDIGYTDPDTGFSADDARVMICLRKQSPDIARGVDAETSQSREQGAGDQGMMFGYACNETPAFMPATIYYAHKIVERLAQLRHQDPVRYGFLRPDAKSQVSFVYENGLPARIQNIVVSHQHRPEMPNKQLEELVHQVIGEVIPAEFLNDDINFYINPTGRFVIGGPDGDTGLTGRKIIVDTYGGIGRHGGGAFSGKDPSKVDRSAAYMARYVAKNIVAAGLAERCEVQVSYAIGIAKPLSINVDTFGTGEVDEARLSDQLMAGKIFDFRPAAIIRTLGLTKPKGWTYRQTAAYGHFGRDGFPWEKTDKIDELRAAIG
ncbi:MAG: methionine adenosyltransferase [Lentisphaerae bacterium]|jgi:S-adenosylmethionine synthetase|nr:methionine adenosyltransferase [Lentisphaerota bacterium]